MDVITSEVKKGEQKRTYLDVVCFGSGGCIVHVVIVVVGSSFSSASCSPHTREVLHRYVMGR